jgi:hypothetical protein
MTNMPIIYPYNKENGRRTFTREIIHGEDPGSIQGLNSILAAQNWWDTICNHAEEEMREIDLREKDRREFLLLVNALTTRGIPGYMILPFIESVMGKQDRAIIFETIIPEQRGADISFVNFSLKRFKLRGNVGEIGGIVKISKRLKEKYEGELKR